MKLLAGMNGIVIFLIVLGAFALIAIIAFVIYRLLRPKLKDQENQKTEEDYAREELDRVLQPIDDENVSKEIQDYKQNDDEE